MIENAIIIIDYATDNNTSIKKACVEHGVSDTYVKNTKAILFRDYENLDVEVDEKAYKRFMEAYDKYEKMNESKHSKSSTDKTTKQPSNKNSEQTKFNVSGDDATIEFKSGSNYSNGHIKTLDQLLEKCKVDTNKWDVKDYTVNKWDVTLQVDKVPQTFENFQVKARLEKIKEAYNIEGILENFKNIINTYEYPVLDQNLIKAKSTLFQSSESENNMLEISIWDLHLGKLSHFQETHENYDTKIASKRFMDCIQSLLKRAQGFEYSKILFPIGSDFFNSDNMNNTTTHGTPQDEDLRWQKTFTMGTKLIVDAINLLKQTGVDIDVIVIPGNHDFERSYYLGSVIEAWFNEDAQVTVNNSASPRKYYKFGKVLLGFTHGSEEKEGSLPMIMANDVESKPLWSETIYHEWHLGHQHRKKNIKYTVLDKSKMLDEELGVMVRYLSSLTGTEEWHHKKGFIGQIKAGDAFIWNDETGLIAHLNANLKNNG